MRPNAAVLAASLLLLGANAGPTFQKDFDTACREIGSTYAYFDSKATQWNDIPRLYRSDLAKVRNKREFIGLLEHVLDELYDSHAQLTINTPSSPRLVPSGTDLWAEWRDGQAVITDVRAGSDAERAAIRPGSIVTAINGLPIAEAVSKRMGRSYAHSVVAARDWALRAVLAGTHNTPRTLRLNDRTVQLPGRDQFSGPADKPITVSTLASGIGYIRFNDSLGDSATVAAFDQALLALRDAPALVLDLRDTPSGGNTSVARGILGRFVEREMPYQKHVLVAEEKETGVRRSWLELVSPRGPFVFQHPVAVLAGHWTGSMGEGLAIGFDSIGRGTVVGTPMAGLLGATYHIALPNTGIGLNIPAERLYHVNGTPREAFVPPVLVDGDDAILPAALRVLSGTP